MEQEQNNIHKLIVSYSNNTTVSFLERYLAQRLKPQKLVLLVHHNRSTMISVKRESHLYKVRLHSMFLNAPFMVQEKLYDYIAQNSQASARYLQDFIDFYFQTQDSSLISASAEINRTSGTIFQLDEIYEELNQKYFDNQIRASITWTSRISTGKKRRSIRMGSYSMQEQLIRIHPSLDRSFVPRYFISWVVYHEMLHQKHGVYMINNKKIFHSKQFLAEERLFEEFKQAKQWEKENLQKLLYY